MGMNRKHNNGHDVFVPNGRAAEPTGFKLQFASMAGKKRALAAYNEKQGTTETDYDKVEALCAYALPRDLVKVPMFRGYDNVFAGKMRATVRRDRRKQAEQNATATAEAAKTDLQPTEQAAE